MKNKLQLQDFTFFINILKDSNKWNIDDLTKKLGKDIETIVYMLNIMSEVYSVNGENFIDFEIDSSENLIFFEYSSTFKELNTITDFELFKIYNLLKSNQNLNIQNINKKDYKNFSNILDMYFDEKSNIEFEDNLSIHLLTDINIDYLKKLYGSFDIQLFDNSNNKYVTSHFIFNKVVYKKLKFHDRVKDLVEYLRTKYFLSKQEKYLNVEIIEKYKKDYDRSIPFKNLNLRDFLKNDMLEKLIGKLWKLILSIKFQIYSNSHNHKILNIWITIY